MSMSRTRSVQIAAAMASALLLAVTASGCVALDPSTNTGTDRHPVSTPAALEWELQRGHAASDAHEDSVEWVDAEAGTFLLTYLGGALKDEELAEVRLGPTGADFVIDPASQGGPDLGEWKTYLTSLPAHFDRDVPVRVSVDGRPKGVLPPAGG